jgi:HEAT repeat protein
MEDVEEIGSNDYVLFETWHALDCRIASRVRELAVRTLWEYELPDLVPMFIEMMESDEDVEVRAVAATALGQYVYLGEIEELPASKLRIIEEKLLQSITGQNPTLVRRRALEALGYSSREELPALIEAAYYSDSNEWLASALFAMGRSANRAWNSSVVAKLDHDVRCAG